MRVPDPTVELVRALVDFPEHRQQLMPKLIDRIVKQAESKDFDDTAYREAIIHKLTYETYMAPGSRGKARDIVQMTTYDTAQVNEMRYIMQKAITLAFARKLEVKDQGQTSIDNRNKAVEEFKKTPLIHRNAWIDKMLGIQNTASWNAAMTKIRADALARLESELAQKQTDEEKITLLRQARAMTIFNEHRNNFILFGAFGRTQAVRNIDHKIEELIKSQNRLRML